MKPLMIILKSFIICYLWSIVFIDGIRVLLLINWRFDIFLEQHWGLLKYKWNSGAPVSGSELIFLTVIFSSIPLWFSGWIGLCLVKWKYLCRRIIFSPIYLYRKLTVKTKPTVVVKKRSTIEQSNVGVKKSPIKRAGTKRPVLPSVALSQAKASNPMSAPVPYVSKSKKPEAPTSHALFDFDDDDFDLDFDFEDKSSNENDLSTSKKVEKDPIEAMINKKPVSKKQPPQQKSELKSEKDSSEKIETPKNEGRTKVNTRGTVNNKESHTPVLDLLKQKDYDIISSAIIKGTTIDQIAVSKKQLFLCYVDKEIGDWLADEDKFNDEEPLWFSESSHRISPVRKIDLARDVLKTKLALADLNFEIVSHVVIQSGNIINAEDMLEIWKNMNINVTRISRGSPKEMSLFSKTIENCEEKTDKATLDKLTKLIRSIA